MSETKKFTKILYTVDNDTPEAIDTWDELDDVRDDDPDDREINVAVFESQAAAKEYLKQAKIYYDLVVKFEETTENTGFYDVYNPAACDIVDVEGTQKEIDEFAQLCRVPDIITLEKAKHIFDAKIKEMKENLKADKSR